MAAKKNQGYGNESISALKGADRVRKRPGVIFGSDGLEGCEHSVFEILSNSIDEAREGFGSKIILTCYRDHSIEVQDFGRGIPVDYNPKEERYNWELVESITPTKGKAMNFRWDSTDWALVRHSIPLSILMRKYTEMDIVTISILKRERTSAG